MKRPFMYFTIALILGIIFAYYINVNSFWILGLLIGLILIQIIRLNKSNTIFLLFSLFLLGAFLANLKLHSSKLLKHTNTQLELKGKIVDVVATLEDESKYILLVESLSMDQSAIKVSEKTILKIIGDKQLGLGDKIRVNGVLKEPLTNTNPKLYNYKLNLLTKGIYTNLTLRDYAIIEVEKAKLDFSLRLKSKFTERVEYILGQNLSYKNASIMKSIILGNSSYLEEKDTSLFRDLGLAHILAVSGLHIGIIAGLLGFLFSHLGINKKINVFLTLVILWLYAYAIGWPSSVLRANIMFSFLLISQLIHEPYDSINILALSCFILLIFNPFFIFSVGFQLSYLASFFILYFGPKLNIFLSNSVSGILAVQIGLLPVQAYYFNKIPLLSLLANLLLVPAFSLCLILTVLLILLPLPFAYITGATGLIIDFLLNIQIKIMEILNYFPLLGFRFPSLSMVEILLYYLLVLMLFKVIRIGKLKKNLVKTITLYLLILIIFNLFLMNMDQSISVNFIDVGQGDSILIKTQKGNYLIDTGGNILGDYDIGENILLPYLYKAGIFKLKGVFISHFDGDHCKSLAYLMDNMKIENIYFGYKRPGNIYYDEIVEKARYNNIPISLLNLGDRISLDKNTEITVVGPEKEILNNPNNSDNDMSLVLMLNYFHNNILFTGDIEALGERALAKYVGQADFLKVPHHGSKTSSSEELLNIVEPNIAFISLGRNNSFGHPHREVLDRYNNRGIELYRTDELGLISLILNKGDYIIRPYLKEKVDIKDFLKDSKLCIIVYMVYVIISYYLTKYFKLLDWEMRKIELQRIY